MHYGYVGRVAGFTLEELIWGSDMAQLLAGGTVDPDRDKEAITESYALRGRTPVVSWQDVTAVAEGYGQAWSGPARIAAEDQAQ